MKARAKSPVWEIMAEYERAKDRLTEIRGEVGPLLRETREQQGLGLREVARRADVSSGLLSLIERNKSWCPKVAAAVARALK